MTTSWASRSDLGFRFEREVAEYVRELGYEVVQLGQGTFDASVRERLRVHNTPLRWLFGDYLAVRDRADGVYLLDPKARRPDQPNHAIECAALEANLQLENGG